MSTDPIAYWDDQSATFDDEPDHGLRDPAVRQAWRELLVPLIGPGSRIADIGCGAGSLSVLLAQAGHQVSGIDLSPRMVEAATVKATAAGAAATFAVGDAQDPLLAAASFDLVLVRHVLWALPDPVAALRRWDDLLRPGGSMLLVEGSWSTGAGLTGEQCRALMLQVRQTAEVRHLDDATLWGRATTDERYLLLSRS